MNCANLALSWTVDTVYICHHCNGVCLAVVARADHRLRGEDREAGQGVQGTRGVADRGL